MKFIYTSKIYSNQSIDCSSTDEKKWELYYNMVTFLIRAALADVMLIRGERHF